MHVVLDEIRSEKSLWYEVYVVSGENIISETDEVFGTIDAAISYFNKMVERWINSDD